MKQAPATPIHERLAALSEPIRLRIARLVAAEELSVGEVAKVLQVPQSTVSRHLKLLAETGWIGRRSEGTATLYRLHADDLPPEIRPIWLAVKDQAAEPETKDDLLRLQAVLAERRTDSLSFFGRVGGEWDHVRDELFGRDFTARAMLSLIPPTWTVADLGCGTGNVAELLAPVVGKVIAVDGSETMIGAAKRRLDGAKNVVFRLGTLDALPLEDRSVDAAVLALVLHHMPEPAKAIAEARRVVKPRGVVLVVDMVSHDRNEYRHTMGHQHLGFSHRDIEAMCTAVRLQNFNYRILQPAADSRGPALFVSTATVP